MPRGNAARRAHRRRLPRWPTWPIRGTPTAASPPARTRSGINASWPTRCEMSAHRVTRLTAEQRATIARTPGGTSRRPADTGPVDWDAWEPAPGAVTRPPGSRGRGTSSACRHRSSARSRRRSSPCSSRCGDAARPGPRRAITGGRAGPHPCRRVGRLRARLPTVESAVLRLLDGAVDARVFPRVRREVGAAMLSRERRRRQPPGERDPLAGPSTPGAHPNCGRSTTRSQPVLADVTRVVSRGAAGDRVPDEWLRDEIRTHLTEVRQRHVGRHAGPLLAQRAGLPHLVPGPQRHHAAR